MPPTDAELVELEARRQELRAQYLRPVGRAPRLARAGASITPR